MGSVKKSMGMFRPIRMKTIYKKVKTRNIIFSLVFLLFLLINWQCKPNGFSDVKADGEVLDSLYAICTELGSARTPDLLEAISKLRSEAFKQQNDLCIGHSYVQSLAYYLNTMLYDSKDSRDTIQLHKEKATEYLQKAGDSITPLRLELSVLNWELFFTDRKGLLVKIFNLLRNSEKTNDNRVKSEAYFILGQAYILSNNPTEAINAYEKQLEFLRKINNSADLNYYYLRVFSCLAEAALQMNYNESALAYTDSVRLYIKNHPEDYVQQKIDYKNTSDYLSVRSLVQMGKLEAARPIVEELSLYCDSIKNNIHNTENYFNIQLALALYYLETKEYNKALDLINKVYDYYSMDSTHDMDLNYTKDKKADILAALGRFEEAFKLRTDVLSASEANIKENAAFHISEMYTLYNVEKLEKDALEKETKARIAQTIAIFLVIICILLIVIVIISKRNSQKLKIKNEKLFAQYQDIDKYINEVQNLNHLVKKTEEKTEDLSLFEKIEFYLHTTEYFKESSISREFIATQLGTNRQYLTEAIQENVGMTFMEYINEKRLDYARRLLTYNEELSIDEIYVEAGFNSKRTFYRLFKQKYDLTPKELREIAIEEKKTQSIVS